ncbi:peptide chain release factor 3, partial [bacterium]|nr:peptide chain release factor 3 [bacterium]
MGNIQDEIAKRRTFAIISHPDAGKTTLTEKFLLFGGAIQTAGAVKNNKITKTAASDFMEIERQRGISVATSVMAFNYRDRLINLLDTPGHRDFAEDTYRTLTAVDSVILVIDCVKGVEAQTERLMEVCRMRKTPVIIFINKMDLEGQDPFDLLDELEVKLKINVRPLSWPISGGQSFKGVYSLYNSELRLFNPDKTKISKEVVSIEDIQDASLNDLVTEQHANQLREDVELITGVYETWDSQPYLDGDLAPVFFGSAVNNFGIQEMLDTFIDIAPDPRSRPADVRDVHPEEEAFSGFIFKIHANIDPRHRDRIAFLRVCSGQFQRNTFYYHTRLTKKIKFSNPATFLAQDKSIVEEAWPGDVVG